MKLFVDVKTNSKVEKVEKIEENRFKIKVSASPVDGRANLAVIKLLAKHLGVSQSRVNIVSGHTSKRKVFEIG